MPPTRGKAAQADADADDEMVDGGDGEWNHLKAQRVLKSPKLVLRGRGAASMAAADDDDDDMHDSAEGGEGGLVNLKAPVRRGRGAKSMAAADDDEDEMYDGTGEGGLNVKLPARRGRGAASMAADDDDDDDGGMGGEGGEQMSAPVHRGRGRGSRANADGDDDMVDSVGGDGEVMAAPVHRGAGRGKQSMVDDDNNMLDATAGGDGEVMGRPVHRGAGRGKRSTADDDDDMSTLDHTDGLSLREVSMKISASQSMMPTRGGCHNGVVRNSGVLDGGDFPDAPPVPTLMRRSMSLGSGSMRIGQIVSTGGSFEGRAQISPMRGSLAAIEGSVSVTADDARPSARLRGCGGMCRGSFLFRLRLWLRGTPTERGLRLPNGRKPRSDHELQLAIGHQIQAAAEAPATEIAV